ncbi:hypothetical protein MW887_007156 [Aspergillus wentii]|nr:hypothetical protein MW887_007156 [Aspergillus wentii]
MSRSENSNTQIKESDDVKTVKKFFHHLYPVPSFSFLHPPSTIAKCHDGTLDESLLLAIQAIVTLRLGQEDKDESTAQISKAEDIIWQRLESPSVSRLQALLLVIIHRVETGGFQRAFMLAGLASRAASAMRLNYEKTDLTPVAAEVRRRTIWCFKLIESYFSIGLSEFELCPFETIYLQPPSHETSFVPPDAGDIDKECGTLAISVRLASLRRDIMKLTRELAVCDRPFVEISKVIRSLEQELWELHRQMPYNNIYTTLDIITKEPWLSRHVMMMTSWHQCFCDLYRLLLPGCPEAPPRIVLDTIDADHRQQAGSICQEHAMSIIQLLCDINQRCTVPYFLEFDTAICAYHATRLMIFLSSQSRHPTFTASRVEQCLEAIKRFFRPSSLIKPILDDMQQLIDGLSTTPEVAILSQEPRDPPISSPAKVRQRLAIHSLLRQAEFSDDETTSPV